MRSCKPWVFTPYQRRTGTALFIDTCFDQGVVHFLQKSAYHAKHGELHPTNWAKQLLPSRTHTSYKHCKHLVLAALKHLDRQRQFGLENEGGGNPPNRFDPYHSLAWKL